MRCPICKKKLDPKSAQYAPFCSERCKLVDLGRWLGEDYRIPGEPAAVPEKREDEKDEDER